MDEQTDRERRREQSSKCGRSVRARQRPFFVGPQLSAYGRPQLTVPTRRLSLVFLPHPLWYVCHVSGYLLSMNGPLTDTPGLSSSPSSLLSPRNLHPAHSMEETHTSDSP